MKIIKLLKGFSAASLAAAAVAVTALYGGGITASAYDIEKHTQEEIRAKYQELYFDLHDVSEYSEDYSATSPCSAGDLTDATRQDALDSVNFVRYIAGLPYDVGLKDEYNTLTQHASLVNYMNNSLSHFPVQPDGLEDDLYELGYTGAGRSNIGLGYSSIPSSVTMGYMEDTDTSNIATLGHRRWVLNPSMQYTGFGMVGTSTAMYAHDMSRSASFTGDYICWPAENTPYELVDTGSYGYDSSGNKVYYGYAYSVTLGNSYDTPDSSKVTVDVTSKKLGKSWHLDSSCTEMTNYFKVENNYYGMPKCIIFNVGVLPEDDVVSVTIKGIYKNGVETPISYKVNYFDLLDSSDYEIGFGDKSYEIEVGETLILKGYSNPLNIKNCILWSSGGSSSYIDKEFLLGDTIKVTGKAEGSCSLWLAYGDESYSKAYITVVAASNITTIPECTVSLSQSSYTYDGMAKTPSVTVKAGSKTLTEGTDYTVSYSGNVNVGTAKVTVTGKGKYSGSTVKNFGITARSLGNCTVSLGSSQEYFRGVRIKPTVTVKINGTAVASSNYSVSYTDNLSVGTAKVTVTGKGNLTGSVVKNFEIVQRSVGNCDITLGASTVYFNGARHKPVVTVACNGTTLYSGNYTASYTNNLNVGTATVTLTGKNNLKGTTVRTFKVVARSIKNCDVTLTKNLSSPNKPNVTVKIGDYVVYSGNYTVKYSAVSNGKVTVTITGKNNLKDTVTKTYTV